MKKLFLLLIISILFLSSCGVYPVYDIMGENTPAIVKNTDKDDQQLNTSETSNEKFIFDEANPDYREAMRQWVISISDNAKSINPDFMIVPQNCSPLFTLSGESDGQLAMHFIEKINGAGQECVSFGYDDFNRKTDDEDREYISSMLNLGIEKGLNVLSVNYCTSENKKEQSYRFDDENGYISFVSPTLELDSIYEDIINENENDIISLGDAKNWLCLLNPEKYEEKQDYINDLCSTNYDVLVIDAFFYDSEMLTMDDLEKLKVKENGGKRIVISYLSIGEAEDYRYYWRDDFFGNPPDWMLTENPKWEGNYPVEYWNEEWQNIIAFSEESYLHRIIEAGFDGAYLDIVDGYETFEYMNE